MLVYVYTRRGDMTCLTRFYVYTRRGDIPCLPRFCRKTEYVAKYKPRLMLVYV
jgi:hypothetical protein